MPIAYRMNGVYRKLPLPLNGDDDRLAAAIIIFSLNPVIIAFYIICLYNIQIIECPVHNRYLLYTTSIFVSILRYAVPYE